MTHYNVLIRLDNGDKVAARVLAATAIEAEKAVMQTTEVQDFIGTNAVQAVEVSLSDDNAPDVVDASRYHFAASHDVANGYVVTDTEAMAVVTFVGGQFADTHKVTFLNEIKQPDALALARVMRGIADYLLTYHPEVIR